MIYRSPRPPRRRRDLARLVALALALSPAAARAQAAVFDLSGPAIEASVSRGELSLPLGRVPNLAAGDRLRVRALLPEDQSERFLMVVAFLRGATNPPPREWFHRAQTWRADRATIDVAVPEGAEQAILFLAPETGGGFDAIQEAVRGRPGIFVRAAQDLGQASLDRARLDSFVAGIEHAARAGTQPIAAASEALGRSLGVRADPACLARPTRAQAACLAQSRDSMLLYSARGTSLAETLTGAPTDIAYRVSATREGGAGSYSPYIGVVRDVARLLGAFQTAQYQYIPTLTTARDGGIGLLLNTAPSFAAPQSVLVAALPAIGAAAPPRLTAPGSPLCLGWAELVVPVGDLPPLYATGYARDLSLSIRAADGRVGERPLRPDAAAGGLVAVGGDSADLTGPLEASLRGAWGFDPFPATPVAVQAAGGWQAPPDASVVVGRDNRLRLAGGAPACVESVSLAAGDGAGRAVEWAAAGADAIEVVLPLADAQPGALALLLRQHGQAEPARVAVRAVSEPSRIERLSLHRGDRRVTLTGSRLDQVAEVAIGDRQLRPGTVRRQGEGDRLDLSAEGDAPLAGEAGATARVSLKDGRRLSVPVTLLPPRPSATLIGTSSDRPPAPAGTLPIELPAKGVIAADARLTFSLQAPDGGGFTPADAVEIMAEGGTGSARITAADGLRLQDRRVAVVTVAPGRLLGPSAFGPLRYRVVRGDVAGDWQPLVTLVRLPTVTALDCAADAGCTLRGDDLFLVAAVAADAAFSDARAVPSGFTGTSLPAPAGVGAGADGLFLRLRDDPDGLARVAAAG